MKGLRSRPLAYCLAVLFVAVVSTSFYAGARAQRIIHKEHTRSLTDAARVIQGLLLSYPWLELDSFCKAAGTPGTRITVLDTSGQVLGDSHSAPSKMPNLSVRAEIRNAIEGRTSSTIRYSETLGREMLYVALPAFAVEGRGRAEQTPLFNHTT